ncbi:MAG: glycosyltransferase family 2 protein [Granulosicoccus sp.]
MRDKDTLIMEETRNERAPYKRPGDAVHIVTPGIDKPRKMNSVTTVLSVVIPVHNEANTLLELRNTLQPVLDSIGMAWEVIFVDDGSVDRSLDMIATLCREDARYKAVVFSRNFGKEVALAAGMDLAAGRAVVLMDADLQHPPALIIEFIAQWRAGYQNVYGVRQDREADSRIRGYLSRMFYALFEKLSGTSLPAGAGDFRLLDRKAVETIKSFTERSRFTKGIYSWVGYRSIGVPFEVPVRSGGKSSFGIRSLLGFAMDGIASFSMVPLRISALVGLFISLVAFCYVIVFFTKTMIFGIDVPGFPTLVVSTMLLSGVQLLSLGVIGEYIGRIYKEVKGRPLYVISEMININKVSTAESAQVHR